MNLRSKTETSEKLMQVQLPKGSEELAALLGPKPLPEIRHRLGILQAGKPLEPLVEQISNLTTSRIVNPLKEAIVALVRLFALRIASSNIRKKR